MESPAQDESGFVGGWSVGALIALVLTSVVPAIVVTAPGRAALIAALAVGYLLTTTLGARAVERAPSRRRFAGLFAAQLAGCALVIVASRGYTTFIVLGTMSQAVLYLRPRVAALVIVAGLGLVALALVGSAPDAAAAASGLVILTAAAGFVIAFSSMALRQHRLRAALAAANHQLRRHADEAAALAAERERVRIARDMHDAVGHCLTTAHVQLEVAAAVVGNDRDAASRAIDSASRSTRDALAEVRRTVAVLRDEATLPLAHGLEALVVGARDSGIAASLDVEGTPRRLAAPVELTLFRVAQEAFTNVHRHARATRVDVTLRFHDGGAVRLAIADDGIGPAETGSGGFGLRGMRERLAAVGGRLRIEREAPGFVVEAEVP